MLNKQFKNILYNAGKQSLKPKKPLILRAVDYVDTLFEEMELSEKEYDNAIEIYCNGFYENELD